MEECTECKGTGEVETECGWVVCGCCGGCGKVDSDDDKDDTYLDDVWGDAF